MSHWQCKMSGLRADSRVEFLAADAPLLYEVVQHPVYEVRGGTRISSNWARDVFPSGTDGRRGRRPFDNF